MGLINFLSQYSHSSTNFVKTKETDRGRLNDKQEGERDRGRGRYIHITLPCLQGFLGVEIHPIFLTDCHAFLRHNYIGPRLGRGLSPVEHTGAVVQQIRHPWGHASVRAECRLCGGHSIAQQTRCPRRHASVRVDGEKTAASQDKLQPTRSVWRLWIADLL